MNTNDKPLNQVRRQDRAVNDDTWIVDFLQRAPYGVLATARDGQPFAHTNLFVYDKDRHAIYLHTATKGRTPDNVRADGRVCFTAATMGRLLPAEEASEVSVEYASVVVFGQARILEDEEEMIYGLQRLMDKYFPHLRPGKHYPPLDRKRMEGAAVHRIDVHSWSGKRKQAPADFPGAFFYGEHD